MLDTSAVPARKSQLLIHPAPCELHVATVLLLKGKLFATLHMSLSFHIFLFSLFDLFYRLY